MKNGPFSFVPSGIRFRGAALIAGALFVVFGTFRDYGISWDETVQSTYGELVVDYYRTGFRDTRCNQYKNLMHYGPLFEAACAAVYRTTGWDKYLTRHLLSALAGIGLVAAVLRLGSAGFGSARPAFFAALFLFLSPRVYGHFFINSKDIPFACAFAWSMSAVLSLCRAERFSRKRAVAGGIAIGLTLAIRVGGFFLLPLLAAGLLFRFGFERRGPATRGSAKGIVAGALAAAGIAWIVMTAFWPATHTDPLRFPLAAFENARNFAVAVPVLFAGTTWSSFDLPAGYLLRMIAITTPPFLLLISLFGMAAAARHVAARPERPESGFLLLTLLWLLTPLAFTTILRPNVYDGIRHFLFIIPALALLGGYGTDRLLRRLPSKAKRAGLVAAAALTLLPIVDLVRLHPYQMTYYNFLAGRDGTPRGGYETDYWATSYREGMEWINKKSRTRGSVTVLVAANPFFQVCAEHFKGPNVTITCTVEQNRPGRLPEGIDYYLATARYGFHRNFPEAPAVHVVARDGRALCYVRGRSAGGERDVGTADEK